MDGFKKLDLSSSESPEASPAGKSNTMRRKNTLSPEKKRNFLIAGGVALFLILFLALGIALPAIKLYGQAKVLKAQASQLSAALKDQNIDEVSTELTKTQTEFDKTKQMVDGLGYMHIIPIANFYYNDLNHAVNAGEYGLQAARISVNSLLPFADVLGLKGKGSFQGGSGANRLQTLVLALDKVTPQIDKIADLATKAKTEIDAIDPNHYPSFIGGGKVRNDITGAKTSADEAISFITEAKPLVKALPALLGAQQDTRYLVVFQNDKELRPTGGFITEYAIMRMQKGQPVKEKSDDIYSLDASIPGKGVPPRILAEYLPAVPQFNVRDSNISPDFLTSMQTFYSMYSRSSQKQNVQGIVALDTEPLITAINVFGGSINVDGFTYTTQTDKRCNCPNVIYQLELFADQPVGFIKDNRKGVLSDMLSALMQKVFEAPTRSVLGPLMQGLIADAQQKHIQFYLFDQQAQAGIEALNVGGRLKDFSGDYLAINDANFGGAKSNIATTEKVTQDYQVAGDGTITKTITINYKNTLPPSDCNLEHGQLCLNAPLRNLVRVYVPKGSMLKDMKGTEVKPLTYEESNKTVFEGFLVVRPLGTATLTLSYTLPFKLQSGSPLPALYQKQAGTYDNDYVVNLNGHKVQEFPLLTDTNLTLKP